ncbi:MAG: polyvinylalcohol dehydrogenase [Acidobacteria bacterium]|nr:polyvinylalcohol dehydrogenase [Acidobacteriota bacterium]
MRLAFAFIATSCIAADWPQWLGPARDGHASRTETGLLNEWPKDGPRMLWRIERLGDGYGAPAVVGGRLYVISNQGMDEENLSALSVEDGKALWRMKLGPVGNPDQAPAYPAARSTPSIDGNLVYAFSSNGDLVCAEIASGKVRWRKSVRDGEFGGVPGKWAYSESPLVDGNAVLVSPGGAQASLLALDKRTGKVIWKSALPGGEAAAYSSAVISIAGGRRQYVQFMSKGVVGVDAKTGELLWRYDETSKGPANIPTPVVSGDYVYSTARSMTAGALVKLNPATGKAEQVYFERGLPSAIGGAVKVGDTLYGTTSEGLIAADFATGKQRWKNESVGAGSILHAAGRFYVYGEDGAAALVEANPEAYVERGRFTPPGKPAHPRGAREKSWAYPVVANGRLYLRDLGVMWCYDVRAK